MPILFYPAKQLIAKSVKELILSPIYQAEAMRLVSERVDSMASIAPMDLSLEAEAFGLKIEFSADRAPRAIGQLINSKEDAKALKIPTPTRGRIGEPLQRDDSRGVEQRRQYDQEDAHEEPVGRVPVDDGNRSADVAESGLFFRPSGFAEKHIFSHQMD